MEWISEYRNVKRILDEVGLYLSFYLFVLILLVYGEIISYIKNEINV